MFCASVGCLCLLLAASACSHYRAATTMRSNNLRAYEGTMRGKGEVSYLGCGASDLEIAEIDEKPLGEIRAESGFEGSFSYLEIVPGPHSVGVTGTTFDTTQKRFHTNLTIDIASYTSVNTGEATLKFTAEAGHVYLIGTKVEKAEEADEGGKAAFILKIFIKDAQTKQVIAEDKREFIK